MDFGPLVLGGEVWTYRSWTPPLTPVQTSTWRRPGRSQPAGNQVLSPARGSLTWC